MSGKCFILLAPFNRFGREDSRLLFRLVFVGLTLFFRRCGIIAYDKNVVVRARSGTCVVVLSIVTRSSCSFPRRSRSGRWQNYLAHIGLCCVGSFEGCGFGRLKKVFERADID
jgi:hypothetical protein